MKLILFEIAMFVQVPVVWYLFKRYAGRVVTGEMIAGAMIGFFNEFATEPLWDYHLRLTYYKDTPVAIILCWAVMFTVVVFVSEKIYCFARKRKTIKPGDKTIFLCDLLAAALIAFPVETLGIKTGIWTYRYDRLNWDWGTVPFFNMPWEALYGYCLLMLIGPSFVRVWEHTFDAAYTGEPE
jgi:hypothetical protein